MKKYFIKHKGLLALTILFIILTAGVQISLAFLMKAIVDIGNGGTFSDLYRIMIISLLYVLAATIIGFLNKLFQNRFIKTSMIDLKTDIFAKVMDKDIKDFNNENSAQYISLLTNDMTIIEQDYFLNILEMIYNIARFILALISIIIISIYITMGVFVIGFLPIIIPILFGKKLSTSKKLYSDNLGHFTTKIKDIFSGFEVVKSFNIVEKIHSEFHKSNTNTENSKYKFNILSSLVEVLSENSGFLIFIATFGIGTYLVIAGDLTFGSMIAAIQLMNSIVLPIVMISTKINKLKSIKLIEEKILNITQQTTSYSEGIIKDNFENRIDFTDVHFSYNEERKALKGISFNIKKDCKYAIVGGSGSGKSTILKLLLNYYDTFDGSITIDGVDNRNIKSDSLYNMVSVIQQNVFMFDDSIKDNITLYQNYSEEAIKNAVTLSGLTDLVHSLPKDIESPVGENGCNLSGGEKQRIAIARALIKNTSILVLDEATSSLDNETSYSIEKSLLKLKDLTCLVVTHKLVDSLLRQYDGIIMMKDGKISEIGTFDELIERKNFFYSLYNY